MSKELKNRTKIFSIAVIDLVEKIDYSISKKVVMTQLVRSATSVGANYHAACRARSDREFIAKLNIVLEEADECCFWLEIVECKKWAGVTSILAEANELTAIFVTSLKSMNEKRTLKIRN